MKGAEEVWAVLSGPIAGYTIDLFNTIERISPTRVRFISSSVKGLASFEHEKGANGDPNHIQWNSASDEKVARFLREASPSVVFLFGTEPRMRVAKCLLRLPPSVPILFATDKNIEQLSSRVGEVVARWGLYIPLFARVTCCLCLGLTNEWALKLLGARRVEHVPFYTVDFPALDAGIEAGDRTEPAEGRPVSLLVIARLTWEKNLPAVLSALAKAGDLAGRVAITIIGDGPHRQKLEELKTRHPEIDLRLLGAVPREKLGSHFAQSDGLLLPSVSEQWGIVVMEALGMGVPVIATPAVGAAVSLAGTSQAVVLSDTCDPDSVVQAIRDFLQRRVILRAAARANATLIRAKFDRERVARQLVDLTAGLVQEAAQRPQGPLNRLWCRLRP